MHFSRLDVIFVIQMVSALFFSATSSAAVQAEAPVINIRYIGPGSIEGEDKRNDYYIELLKHALARTGKHYSFEMGPRGLSGLRQLYAVADGTVDVGWSLTTPSIEESLIPIRIPLDKGLIGWRLFLINKDDTKLFGDIKTVDELRKITLGQGQDWPDTPILRANNFAVQGVSTYSGTFKMLKQKRIRYFPRSILEIWAEVDEQKELDLAIEDTLSIRYPAAFYFFIRKENPQLAHDIETGLEAMIKDGEFDRIFNKNYAHLISKAHLDKRRTFVLDNPSLPKETPLNRPELWFDFPNDVSRESAKDSLKDYPKDTAAKSH
jgi:hypothetical protein